jgi:hypothetical protein
VRKPEPITHRKPPFKERVAIAYHEAGHVVARFFSEGGSLGHVRGRYDDPEDALGREAEYGKRLAIETEIISALAGQIAEKRGVGRSTSGSAESNGKIAADLAFSACGGEAREAGAFLNWLRIRTENLIEFYWTDVERVTQALLERKTLSGNEVRKIILHTPK